MSTMIAAAAVGSPHGSYVHQLCGVGEAVMQGDSQVAILCHLQQFEAHVLTSVTLTYAI